MSLLAKLLLLLIAVYQRTLSPDHGVFKDRYPHGFCRFYPSCSEYTKQSIQTQGAVKGTIKGIIRIIRCNPFVQPGIDLPN